MADGITQVQDYESRHSIVITPAKMVRYYENVKLGNESYPWSTVFDEHSSISRMYRDLGCQHYLVQERDDQRPDIAGLTTVGFERWVTLLIRAYPEEEHRRLQKAILDMPITNPDNNERFPKEISRRLFPQCEDRGIRDHPERVPALHDTVFHTSSADKQGRDSQNHRRQRISFVLPTDSHSDSSGYFDEPAYKGAKRAKRQPDKDIRSYRASPRRYKRFLYDAETKDKIK
ncbi:hypothetical protein OEA41_009297 [Lepraria neglecta]|uniref:DUF7514 domain-containing protein n=1 Tax=Lepraria neglecta TaxID=209136 RepID=A0AAD9Z5L2_9LECA|nr:hypothetical protein OEA41_009297 [Lepraria neglecta]